MKPKSGTGRLPKPLQNFIRRYPAIWEQYNALGESCYDAGPLDRKTLRLVKLALSIGARAEGAVHSHAKRALEEGIRKEEILHAALMAMTTIGLPSMIAAMSWIEDVFEK